MASKKSGGSSSNLKDSNAQYRGLKKSGGQKVLAGQIIVRQLGTKYFKGENTGIGRDFTIFAKSNGTVTFSKGFKGRTFINVR